MSMKKDIVAAITFLVTGLLFAVVQMEGREDAFLADEADCMISEIVVQKNQLPPFPDSNPVTRDS